MNNIKKPNIINILYDYFHTLSKNLKSEEEYINDISQIAESFELDARIENILKEYFFVLQSRDFIMANFHMKNSCPFILNYEILCTKKQTYNLQQILVIFWYNPFILYNINFHRMIDLMNNMRKLVYQMCTFLISWKNYHFYKDIIHDIMTYNIKKLENHPLHDFLNFPLFATLTHLNISLFSQTDIEFRVFPSQDIVVGEKNAKVLSSIIQNFGLRFVQYWSNLEVNMRLLVTDMKKSTKSFSETSEIIIDK